MKIRPAGVELLHADGQTYIPTLMVALRNLASATTNIWSEDCIVFKH
jgi:hypothetical protein